MYPHRRCYVTFVTTEHRIRYFRHWLLLPAQTSLHFNVFVFFSLCHLSPILKDNFKNVTIVNKTHTLE